MPVLLPFINTKYKIKFSKTDYLILTSQLRLFQNPTLPTVKEAPGKDTKAMKFSKQSNL